MKQREICLDILMKTFYEEGYTNLLMRRELKKLPAVQRPFCSELINGVLRNYRLLAYQYEGKAKKISRRNGMILSMAFYERFFLNEKDYAVNNEYVSLGKNEYERSFLNALLRDTTVMKMPEGESDEDLSIRYSLPLWLLKLLKKQYPEDYLFIMEKSLKRSKVFYRLNTSKASFEDLKDLSIEKAGEYSFTSPDNLLSTEEYKKGLFYVQDVHSSKITEALDLKGDSLFLDVCAAPGGKFFNALEKVKAENAYANDLYEHRVKLIEEKGKSLGYEGFHTSCIDARKLSSLYDFPFDAILLDAPCSGLGVIGRRPDIKIHITPESLDELALLQSEILEEVSGMLKEGGVLVYSTCTLNRKENGKQIASFLEKHPEYTLLHEKTILEEDGDNFYLAKLKKV